MRRWPGSRCASDRTSATGGARRAAEPAPAAAFGGQAWNQLATYIVDEAGYDLYAARKLFIRLARTGRRGGTAGKRALAGFLRTHPTDAKRVAHWSATRRLIESGQDRPESTRRVAERERAERRAARCEQLYREYEVVVGE